MRAARNSVARRPEGLAPPAAAATGGRERDDARHHGGDGGGDDSAAPGHHFRPRVYWRRSAEARKAPSMSAGASDAISTASNPIERNVARSSASRDSFAARSSAISF